MKIDKFGSLFSAKRYKPANRSYFGSNGLYLKNHKFYTVGVTDWGLQLQNGLYVFDENCDSVLTRSYGDTVFYNLTSEVKPFLKDKSKMILFGMTDSTCGINHPGLYKPLIRVVDTNGVLHQTKIYTNTCFYRSLWDADTTLKKGFVFCGAEPMNVTSTGVTKNYIIKLDSNLNQQWYNFVDTGNSLYSSIICLKTGRLLHAHNHSDFNGSTYLGDRITLTKLDAAGNIIWRKRYGSTESGIGVAKVKECSNGDYVLCGEKYVNYTASVSQYMGWIMRTDSMGNAKWWRTYIPTSPIKDTTTQNELYDIIELANKDLVCVGWGGSNGFNLVQETWILKVDSNGCLGAGNCPPNLAIGLSEVKNDFYSFKLYPNPVKDELTVELGDEDIKATLTIINTLGEIIQKSPIVQRITKVQTSELNEGVYFVAIKTSQGSFTKKVIVKR
ncbi:MAG: T9SS type A sorting domain-containing protein [Sphingobacteriaceae bacterium]